MPNILKHAIVLTNLRIFYETKIVYVRYRIDKVSFVLFNEPVMINILQ